jgi:hypothetical protein
MAKHIILLVIILYGVSTSALTERAVKPAYTPPTNAYWQIIDDGGDNVLACVLEGQDQYGEGDDCRVRNDEAFDFTGLTELTVDFDIKLTNESSDDHCLFQIRDMDDASWTTIEDFDADTSGYEHSSYDLINGDWGDWSTEDEVFVRFRWVSDESGTDEGVRVNDFTVEGSVLYNTNILTWNEDHDAFGPGEVVTIDCSSYLDAGDTFYFEFHFYYDVTWPWWILVDDVWVYDSDGDLLPTETFDDWMPEDWWQDQHGQPGEWEQLVFPYVPDSPCAACEGEGPYDASLFCPEMVCDDTDVTLYFVASYNWTGESEYFEINILTTGEPFDFSDDFEEDLSLWAVVDNGSSNLNIEPASFGKIKGMYRR